MNRQLLAYHVLQITTCLMEYVCSNALKANQSSRIDNARVALMNAQNVKENQLIALNAQYSTSNMNTPVLRSVPSRIILILLIISARMLYQPK